MLLGCRTTARSPSHFPSLYLIVSLSLSLSQSFVCLRTSVHHSWWTLPRRLSDIVPFTCRSFWTGTHCLNELLNMYLLCHCRCICYKRSHPLSLSWLRAVSNQREVSDGGVRCWYRWLWFLFELYEWTLSPIQPVFVRCITSHWMSLYMYVCLATALYLYQSRVV